MMQPPERAIEVLFCKAIKVAIKEISFPSAAVHGVLMELGGWPG